MSIDRDRMIKATNKPHSANVRIPTVRSLDEDETLTTKNTELIDTSLVSVNLSDVIPMIVSECNKCYHPQVTSNVALPGKPPDLGVVEEKNEVESIVSIPKDIQKDSGSVWQAISSCEVEPFALS